MTVSYSLAPSDSPLCIVSHRPADLDVLEKAKRCRLERQVDFPFECIIVLTPLLGGMLY